MEIEQEETQPSTLNTAPIFNISEILEEMPSIDDDSCHDNEDKTKNRVLS